MLSRVAAHLYWMSRYLERAENMARILDVTQSLSLLDPSANAQGAATPLVITEAQPEFAATKAELTYPNVMGFLAWDRQHPSSIFNSLCACRENARAVRGSITSEMWENINDTYLQLMERARTSDPLAVDNEFFEWVKERSHLFRGITFGTIRRDQPYHFVRLGTFFERADNTARILNVKYAETAPEELDEPDETESAKGEYYRLSSVLRSVSALEAYRDTYRDTIDARRVAELLIFDARVPRSLCYCFEEIQNILNALPAETGRTPHRIAAELGARLTYGSVDEVFQQGLKRTISELLQDMVRFGDAVHHAYMELR
jgi:uncharacterized alpha-E superfamily protein